jgi:predicted permease
VVLSHAYWRARFAGQGTAIGRAISVNGHPMTVVGVADAGFAGVDLSLPADLFVPLMMKGQVTPTWNDLDNWRSRWVNVMGRRHPGVSTEAAGAALDAAYRTLLQEDVRTARLSTEAARSQFLSKTLLLVPGGRGRSALRAEFEMPLFVLAGMVGVLLLIACANVTNLLLARAAAEHRDIAVQLALGASTAAVIRQRLVECFVLSAGGSALAFGASWWTTVMLTKAAPPNSVGEMLSPTPDLRLVSYLLVVSTLMALLVGIAPAIHAARGPRTPALAHEGARLAGGRRHANLRRILVVAQVALSLVLLSGAGLFARTLHNLRALNPGFAADDLLQFRVEAALSGYSGTRTVGLIGRLDEALESIPGVTSVSMATVPILSGALGRSTVRVQGYQPAAGEDMSPAVNSVGPGYFETMRIPIAAGREFRATDAAGAPLVAIVNQSMADHFWRGASPIGRRFGRDGVGPEEFEVIGVVGDSKFEDMRDGAMRFFYRPAAQLDSLNGLTFYVRHAAGLEDVPALALAAVRRVAPDLPVFGMRTMSDQFNDSLFRDRLVAFLAVLFGILSTVMAGIGLYGLIAYSTSCRRREFGIRMALGAGGPAVLRIVLGETLVLGVAGALIGLPLAFALGRTVTSQVFGLSSTDPVTFAAAALGLATVCLLAGVVPARRATRIDPAVALRQE